MCNYNSGANNYTNVVTTTTNSQAQILLGCKQGRFCMRTVQTMWSEPTGKIGFLASRYYVTVIYATAPILS